MTSTICWHANAQILRKIERLSRFDRSPRARPHPESQGTLAWEKVIASVDRLAHCVHPVFLPRSSERGLEFGRFCGLRLPEGDMRIARQFT
ncbi:MAG: hypothetical protein O2960_07180, partial [Verrucomicrobia bacterium]|nr:hypothetical protein [Verrucomicrobiota bacterium]